MQNIVVKGFNNYYRNMHENMLKSFVSIKSEICSIYKAQHAEENSPLQFTEQFCKMLIA